MNVKTKYVIDNFSSWNKKSEINIGNNRLYKLVGSGPIAFKILKFGPNEETNKPTWSQTWWKYEDLSEIGQKVIDKAYNLLKSQGGQTTL